jgi:hypothetical protein
MCEPGGNYDHWFTGPIFTPNPTTVPPGHPCIEPIFITSYTYGFYDDKWKEHSVANMWSVGPYVDFQCALNDIVGAELIGFLVSNFKGGASSTHLKDTIFRMGFQISNDRPDSWVPDFRVLFQETFPTGKYEKLDPRKKETDLTGQGAFQTGIHLAFQKLFHLTSRHCFSIRGDVGYFFPAPVSVKGLNYYIDQLKVRGKVKPGQVLIGYLAPEFSLTSEWNIGCEIIYQYQRRGHFSGKIESKDIEPGQHVKVPATAQLIIAPELERTITPNLGIIIGSAATLIGKNSLAFSSVFVSVLYLF